MILTIWNTLSKKGHELGLEIHASLNVFCAGHNYFDRGMVYSGHPEWASMVYTPDKGIIPITEESINMVP
ncbi:hypothetical protein NXU83_26820 [Bacteroides thetaiotaomicron]|nr:hypothetical protein [Bacteroides thetaiotaomicron]